MVGSSAPSGSRTMILKAPFICLSPIPSETDKEGLELVLVARVRQGSELFTVKSLRAGSLEVPTLGGGP